MTHLDAGDFEVLETKEYEKPKKKGFHGIVLYKNGKIGVSVELMKTFNLTSEMLKTSNSKFHLILVKSTKDKAFYLIVRNE